MSTEYSPGDPAKNEAKRMMMLLNTLSLFSRRTLVSWMPELVEDMNITEERFMVMFELSLQPDSSLKDLAQSMMISSSSLSVMINSLVEQGIVSRLPDPADRRRVLLRLGPRGEELLRRAEKHLLDKFQEYLESLPAADRQELGCASEALLQVVDRILKRSG